MRNIELVKWRDYSGWREIPFSVEIPSTSETLCYAVGFVAREDASYLTLVPHTSELKVGMIETVIPKSSIVEREVLTCGA